MIFWDKSMEVNNFMNYIVPNGPQFNFNSIKNYKDAGWDHFYTANISIAKEIVGDSRFDPRFVYAAFEDIDFGFLLAQRGLKLIFNKGAIVYHSHFYDPDSFYNRMVLVGRSFVIFSDKHKNNKINYLRLKLKYAPFDLFPGQLRIFNFLSRILSKSRLFQKISVRFHWYFNICYYYSLGMIQFKNKNYA